MPPLIPNTLEDSFNAILVNGFRSLAVLFRRTVNGKQEFGKINLRFMMDRFLKISPTGFQLAGVAISSFILGRKDRVWRLIE